MKKKATGTYSRLQLPSTWSPKTAERVNGGGTVMPVNSCCEGAPHTPDVEGLAGTFRLCFPLRAHLHDLLISSDQALLGYIKPAVA